MYSRDLRDADKNRRASEWVEFLWDTKRGRVSRPAVDAGATIELAWTFQDRCSLSFGDALVLAAAQSMGCGFVLSADVPAGQEREGIRVVSPDEPSASVGSRSRRRGRYSGG